MEKSSTVKTIIKQENFIVFGEDFRRHPHALEHLLKPLFNDNQFIWVETIGLRTPRFNFYDLKRIVGKFKKWFVADRNHEPLNLYPNVHVISPFMIPFNNIKFIRKLNECSVNRSVKIILNKLKIKHPVTITSVPNACDYIGSFNEKLKIYFCVDEFSLWPGLDKELVQGFEELLINKTDIIIATSHTLAEVKQKPKITTPVISHGVEFDHFNIGPKKQQNDNFKICYFGLFDERTNQEILRHISTELKGVEVHIYGQVVCKIDILDSKPNIFFHGPVSYDDLPNAIVDMDAFILPYERNELTNFINPLKLKEYLSTGRPVLATALPEVVKLKDYLFVCNTAQDFCERIEEIRGNSELLFNDKTLLYIKTFETWESKALILSSIIKQNT